MFSTPEGFADDSPIYPISSTPAKKPISKKSLCLFTEILDVKKKTSTRRVGAAKYKRKAIKCGTTSWALKKRKNGIQK